MKVNLLSLTCTLIYLTLLCFVLSEKEILPNFSEHLISDNFGSYSVKRLRELLVKIDSDKDEKITKDELVEWINSLSLKDLDKRAKSDISFYDINKDNKITWIEMLRTTYGYNEESVEKILHSKDPIDKDNYQFIVDDRDRFKAADSDEDGFLTHEEYKSLLNPSGSPKLLKVYMDKILSGHDKDNDTQLSEQEFKLYFYITEDLTETQLQEFENIFLKFDFNKDRKLSIDELEKWYAPDLNISANFEANSLIEKSDTNGDKVLTFDEILSKLSEWKDSQATSYGNHIRDEL